MLGNQKTTREDKVLQDVEYMKTPPQKDLLNYKNMDIEMSLWAKTGTGWMSVLVVIGLATMCIVLMSVVTAITVP